MSKLATKGFPPSIVRRTKRYVSPRLATLNLKCHLNADPYISQKTISSLTPKNKLSTNNQQ
jgi:hypothetical protein